MSASRLSQISFERHSHCGLKSILVVLLAVILFPLGDKSGTLAQVMGEKAEMYRLELKAEEAIANGDPNGATLAIGRAALMASILAKKENNPQTKLVYAGAEDLFRTQENTYRALALFEQAGGQHPAPSGVCQLLSLAHKFGRSATRKLNQATPGSVADSDDLFDRLTEKTQEWVQMVSGLQEDFSCP